jgi:hypothetical protein
MQCFHGQLRDEERVLFSRVSGYFESEGGKDSGLLEIHQGGILGDDLTADRPYHLDLEDGRTGEIRPMKVYASNSAGIARVEFRLVGDLAESAARPVKSFD